MEAEKTAVKTEDRIYWITGIRVFCAFLVVMQHSLSAVWTIGPPQSREWKIVNLVFLFSRCAVPVFFMCSGIGMLAKERTIESIFKKNIFGLLKLYVLWMAVYGVRDGIAAALAGHDIRVIVNAFVKPILFGQYHTWFILTLIGLYLITPFLYEIVKKKTLFRYFLILSVLFTTILPLAGQVSALSRLHEVFTTFHMRFVVGYVMYYVLGFYLVNAFDAGKQRQIFITSVTVLIASALAAFAFSNALSVQRGEAVQTVYGEFTPLGLLLNASFLMVFRGLLLNAKPRAAVMALEKYGAGIYLLHPLLLSEFVLFPGVKRILSGVFVWLAALLICLLLAAGKTVFCKLFLRRANGQS